MRDEILNVQEEMARQGFSAPPETEGYNFAGVGFLENDEPRFFTSTSAKSAYEFYNEVMKIYIEDNNLLLGYAGNKYAEEHAFEEAEHLTRADRIEFNITFKNNKLIFDSEHEVEDIEKFLAVAYSGSFDDEEAKALFMSCIQKAEELGIEIIPQGQEHIFEEAFAEAEKRAEIVEQQNKLQKWQKATKNIDAQTQNAGATSTASASQAQAQEMYLPA